MANQLLSTGFVLARHLSKYFVANEKEEQFEPRISEKAGNLLRLESDGIYYGIEPPKDLGNLFVDAINGVDQHPDDVEGAGSEAKPLRTFAYANRIAQLGTHRTIRLHTEQEHNCTPSNYFSFKAGKVTVFPYGSAFDEELKKAGGDNTIAFSAIAKMARHPYYVLVNLSWLLDLH